MLIFFKNLVFFGSSEDNPWKLGAFSLIFINFSEPKKKLFFKKTFLENFFKETLF
jgi:hypothetical protein